MSKLTNYTIIFNIHNEHVTQAAWDFFWSSLPRDYKYTDSVARVDMTKEEMTLFILATSDIFHYEIEKTSVWKKENNEEEDSLPSHIDYIDEEDMWAWAKVR